MGERKYWEGEKRRECGYVGEKQRRGNTFGRDVGSKGMIEMRTGRKFVDGPGRREGGGTVDEKSRERKTGRRSRDRER